MGKQKRLRQKFHSTLSTSAEKTNNINKVETKSNLPAVPNLLDEKTFRQVFSGINISSDQLKQSLLDDTKSVKSFKSLKSTVSESGNLTKKDKRLLRRLVLLNKIDAVSQMKKARALKKKQQKEEVGGGLSQLLDALPTLEPLEKNKVTRNEKRKPIEKKKKREKKAVKDVKYLKSILSNEQFKKDPLKLISQHINTVILKQ